MDNTLTKDITLKELFLGFATIALKGFGGVAPYVYQELVVERKWMSTDEYSELLSICQILPGANVTNLSAIFGYRICGYKGACVATTGLILPPFIVLITIYHYFKNVSHSIIVQGALKGILSVAIGLILMTVFNMIKIQKAKYLNLFLVMICAISVTTLKFPLIYFLLLFIPINYLFFWNLKK